MELVTYRTFCAVGQAQGRLVTKGIFMLEAAEFAPTGVEFTGHAHHFHAQTATVGRRHGEMVITPAAGGQRLQLQMGIHIGQIPPAGDNMAAIVEHRQARLHRVNGLTDPTGVVGVGFPAQGLGIFRICGIPSTVYHGLQAGRTVALPLRHDVQENAVRIVIAANFVHLIQKIIQIRRVHTQGLVSGHSRIVLKLSLPIPLHRFPFGMAAGSLLIVTSRNIHRGLDSDFMGRLNFRTQQVKIQFRMDLIGHAGVIGPSVMALGEHGNGTDMTQFQHFLKLLLGKGGTDTGDLLGGVKIQMDLAERQLHGFGLLSFYF